MTAAKKKEPEAPAPTPAPGSVTVGPLGRWDQIRMERMTITADQAAYILTNHMPVNRQMIPGQRKRLCKVLQDGHWKFNGETIIFDREGHLKDGQHRLGACADTGIGIDTLVVFGMEPDVFDTIGRCKPRSLRDDLGLEGEIHVSVLASSLRLINNYEASVRSKAIFTITPDSITLRAYLRGHPAIRESALFAESSRRRCDGYIPMQPAIVGACHYLFGLKDSEARNKFFESLRTGASLEPGNPILALRNRIFVDRTVARNLPQTRRVPDSGFTQLVITVRAWNAVRKNRPLSVMVSHGRFQKSGKATIFLPEII